MDEKEILDMQSSVMNMQRLLLVVLFAIASYPTIALSAEYPIYCRGPIKLTEWGSIPAGGARIDVIIKKNSAKAGTNGALLAKGTCAWADRPVSRTEPGWIQLIYAPDKKPAFAAMLTNCANNPECVFSINVENKGQLFDARYMDSSHKIKTMYPDY